MRRLLIALIVLFGVHTAGQTRVSTVGRGVPSPGALTLTVPQISWGVVANPADNPAITTATAYLANSDGLSIALARTIATGVSHVQEVYKWTDIEATLGVYDFTKIDTLVANSGTLPIVMNIAPIWDNGNTTLPATLVFNDFSEAAVTTAYKNMLTALAGHLHQRLYVLLVGSEVDTYLTTGSRRTQYATFLGLVRTHARTLFGTNPFKVATTLRSVAVSTWSDWVDVDSATDLNSFTYYPNDASATFAVDTLTDLTAMTTLGPVMFQELGLSSSAGGGTPALQSAGAQTIIGYVSLLVSQQKSIPVVTWSQLSDLSASVISSFGYSSGQFTTGIGLRDTSNVAKAAFTTLCAAFGGMTCSDPAPPTCEFSLSVPSIQVTANGVSGTVQLIASASSCAWTRTIIQSDLGNPPWSTFTPASGNGSTTFSYTVNPNTSTAGRSAQVLVGGKIFTYTQDGTVTSPPPPPVCSFTASKTTDTFASSAGSNTVVQTASNTSCPWTASVLGGVTWLTLDSYSGAGTSTITYTVTANTSTASRTARFTFGDGDILTVVQSGIELPPPDPDPQPEIVCGSTTTSPTGRTPIFGWTPCRQDTWNHEYSDYLANPAAPPTAGGRWFKKLKDNADCNCRYYDIGQYDVMVYQMTGIPAYADKTRSKMRARFDSLNTLGYADFNIVREEAIPWGWMLDWITDTLTTPQRDAFIADIAYQLEYVMFTRGPLRVGDSDQTTGTYFGVVMFHLLFPANARATALFQSPQIGGLSPSKDATATLTNQDDITARNGIQRYVKVMAEGGEWMESGEYNMGTTNLLMQGYDFVKTATGTNYFPEISAWIPKWGNRLLSTLTPDFMESVMWGDEEIPHYLRHHNWTMDLGITSGLRRGTTIGRKLEGLFNDLIATYGQCCGGQSMEPVANPSAGSMFIFYDPYEVSEDWKTDVSYFGKGIGLLTQRSGFGPTDSLFVTSWGAPRHLATTGSDAGWYDGVDHNCYYFGDWTLWRNHKWVMNHPYTYAGPSCFGEGDNVTLVHGNGSAEEYRASNVIASQTTTHAYTVATTGGSLNAIATPPSATVSANYPLNSIHEDTRELFFKNGVTDTVITFDRLNVSALNDPDVRYPQTTALHPDYFGFNTGLSLAAPNKKLYVTHMPVSPTIAGDDITWADGSENIKWTSVFPASTTKTIFDETAMRAEGNRVIADPSNTGIPAMYCTTNYGCPAWTNPYATELKFHVKLYPTTTQQWDAFLNVFQFGTPGVIVSKSNAGALGVHVTRPTQEDLLVVFNGSPGTNLTLPAYDNPAHHIALDVVRLRGTGYSIPWNAVTSSTLVYLYDLDPSVSVTWTANLDLAGAVTIARCTTTPQSDCLMTSGEYRRTVAGAGAHTLDITGSGSPPPPDPISCPTITLSPTSLADGLTGTAYSQALSASGGTSPYTFTIQTGVLPSGLTLSSVGLLSGTPTGSGAYSFTVKAVQADMCQGVRTYALTIAATATTDIARSGAAQMIYDGAGSNMVLTGAITGGTGSNRLGVLELIGSTTDTLTGCTFDGATMTVVNKVLVPGDLYLYGLRLVAPSTGAKTLTCTFSANTAMAAIWQTYVGVNQTTPIAAGQGSGTFATSTYSSTSTGSIVATVTPAATNTWTVMVGRSWTQINPGAGSNSVFVNPGYGMSIFDAGPHASANVEVSMEGILASSPNRAAAVMFALNPAAP